MPVTLTNVFQPYIESDLECHLQLMCFETNVLVGSMNGFERSFHN